MRRCRTLVFACIALASCSVHASAGERKSDLPPVPKPSENKGKPGTYLVKTGRDGYNYYVYVPKSYSDDNPAGLHLYFHGQGGGGGASGFGQWATSFLEPLNLIGINMQYMDGNNANDTGGKVAAALEAVLQVSADYKILPRRGVVGSFSGGGLPHAGFNARFARGSSLMQPPFIHAALYGSNFWQRAAGSPQMSWFIGLGSEEWGMGQPTLGSTQPARFAEVLKETAQGGSLDVYLKITKGKGHAITDADVADSARQFRRSDLAYCPFLYAADYREPQLRPIVATANKLRLGEAATAADALLATPGISEDLKKKATALKEKISKRVDAVVALVNELAEQDPILSNYYGPVFMKQLAGQPKAAEVKKVLTEARKNKNVGAAMAAWGQFAKTFDKMFNGPKLVESAVPTLEKIKEAAGEKSLLGKMAAEFLTMK